MKNIVSSSFDNNANKNYSHFNHLGPGNWNACFFEERWIDIYKDANFIKYIFTNQIIKASKNKEKLTIVDFGGGDGCLLGVISNQLKTKFDLKLINLDIDKENLNKCKQKFSDIQLINQSVLEKYHKNYADVVLCRFVVHYLSEKEQLKMLENILFTLKPKGIAIFLWPSSKENLKIFQNFQITIGSIISGLPKTDVRKSRVFTSREKFKDFARIIGFSEISELNSRARQFYSIPGWFERANYKKKREIEKAFKEYSEMCPQVFIKRFGFLSYWSDYLYFILKK